MEQQTQSREEEIRDAIDSLRPWFHNLEFPGGIQTAPDHPLGNFPAKKWNELAPHLPLDLQGWTVLDVGCNAGFYSFELARRGGRVLGIDLNSHYLRQARWASRQYGLEDQVSFERRQIYELAGDGRMFDLVLFKGVFYHLRYPLLGLDIVARKAKRLLVFQSLLHPSESNYEVVKDIPLRELTPLSQPGWPRMVFIEHRVAGDPTNWWLPNSSAVEAMLRSTGLKILAQASRETYVCEPDAGSPSCAFLWNEAEYLAATGQPWMNKDGGDGGDD